jgi:aconitase A
MKFREMDKQAARDFLAPLATMTKVADGFYTIAELIGAATPYAVIDQGRLICVVAIQKISRTNGNELVITAARQVAKDGDLTARILPEIERVFGGDCDVMTIYTHRAGLVRKLEQTGFNDVAKIMRKKLK